MKIHKQDLDQFEAWRTRWKRRPHASVVEGKVETLEDGGQQMLVVAFAPGFRPERVVVCMPKEG